MFSYETYVPGRRFGISAFVLSSGLCRDWCRQYGIEELPDGDTAPLGMITLIQQEAFNQTLTPRTPGNVQAEQVFEMRSLPRVGDTVYTEVGCLSKEIRKDRRWVQLEFRTRAGTGDMLFRSKNLIIVPY